MFDDAEVHDQRQVVRRRADELASRYLDAKHVDQFGTICFGSSVRSK